MSQETTHRREISDCGLVLASTTTPAERKFQNPVAAETGEEEPWIPRDVPQAVIRLGFAQAGDDTYEPDDDIPI